MRMVFVFLIGIVIGFVVFAYTPIGHRYEIKLAHNSAQVYKYDKWTGQTYWTNTARKGWTQLALPTESNVRESATSSFLTPEGRRYYENLKK